MPIKLVRAELTDNTLSSTKLIGRIIRNHINYTSTITQNTKQHAVYLCIQVPVSRLDRQNCQQQRRKKNIQSHIWISFVVRGVLIRLGKAISTLRTRFAFSQSYDNCEIQIQIANNKNNTYICHIISIIVCRF
ncbi:hypothetical protein SS50377_22216 [Spironucleus salmonicida]|uniref:Uncharacterized protein n=1 Tax=Spironucleus salmonicida TaxID=348837 RepID=A0A9P8S1E9_9EUKA|nr:hypothetical protein SS50377_22216 [Spironucleus salmonicida]